jgi:adenine-specific DNA-methyltransferase
VLELNKEAKDGERRFILIEQMDYAETVIIPRLKEVLSRNNSRDSFIYTELAKWNEQAKKEINKAKDLSGLVKLLDTLYKKYFLNYNVRIKDFRENV